MSAVEVDGGVAEIAAGGEQKFAHKFVIRLIVVQKFADPAHIDIDRVGPEVDRKFGLHPEHVAETHAPIGDETVVFEKSVDQSFVFAGVPGPDKRLRRRHGGEFAGQVQIKPPHQHAVRSLADRPQIIGLPLGLKRPVGGGPNGDLRVGSLP